MAETVEKSLLSITVPVDFPNERTRKLSIRASKRSVAPGLPSNNVGPHYRISHLIGSGSFGQVYLGCDIRTRECVAIKVEAIDAQHPQLMHEINMYRYVSPGEGVACMRWGGSNTHVRVMVTDLLGETLESLFDRCGRKFSLKTTTLIALQLLHRIEHHHTHHLLHRDIKPTNFMIGQPHTKLERLIHIIDFGLNKLYRDPGTGEHIPFREGRSLIGTPRFASINAHMGLQQSTRDDLESIGYMLVYFAKGKLPWQGLQIKDKKERYRRICELKQDTPLTQLCRGLPSTFSDYISACRQMKFGETADYRQLRAGFYALFNSSGWEDDGMYDWSERVMIRDTATPQPGQKRKLSRSPPVDDGMLADPDSKKSKLWLA